jgi:hypothetical protein
LIVLEVDPQGPAAKAGVRQNDIIRSYDGISPSDQAQLTKFVQNRGEKAIKLDLVRQGKPLALEITPGRRQTVSVALRQPAVRASQIEVVLPGGLLANGPAQDTYLMDRATDMVFTPNLNVLLANDQWRVVNRGETAAGVDEATARRLDELSKNLEKQTALIKELQQLIEATSKARAQEKK